jgi:hypothetical protein
MADTRVKTFDDFAEHARILDVNGNIIICPENRFDFVFEADDASKMTQLNPRSQLWTMVEYEGSEYLWSGFHLVNRMGFVFTEVTVSDPMFDSCRDEDGMVEILYWDETAKPQAQMQTLHGNGK